MFLYESVRPNSHKHSVCRMSHQHVFALSRKSVSILPFYTGAFDLATLNNDLTMAVCVFLCCAGTAIYFGLTEKKPFLNTSFKWKSRVCQQTNSCPQMYRNCHVNTTGRRDRTPKWSFWAAEASISAPFFLFYLISALCLACSVCEVAYLIPL